MTYWRPAILANIAATLLNIKVVNGYKSTVATVENYVAIPDHQTISARTVAAFPLLLIIEEPEQYQHEGGNYSSREASIGILGVVHDNSTPSATMNNLDGDVIGAMLVDILRGENATGTWVRDFAPYEPWTEPPYAAFMRRFTVRGYRPASQP